MVVKIFITMLQTVIVNKIVFVKSKNKLLCDICNLSIVNDSKKVERAVMTFSAQLQSNFAD